MFIGPKVHQASPPRAYTHIGEMCKVFRRGFDCDGRSYSKYLLDHVRAYKVILKANLWLPPEARIRDIHYGGRPLWLKQNLASVTR